MLAANLRRRTIQKFVFAKNHPYLRSGCCIPCRAFHASPRRPDVVLDAIVYLPHEMLSLVHTAFPWYAALPLSAFILRALLVTTAGRRARELMARYIGLHPIRQALAHERRKIIQRRGGFRNPKEALLALRTETKEEVKKFDARWQVNVWGQVGWTFIQLPIFLAMTETIRQNCSARHGLLGLGLSFFRSEESPSMSSAVIQSNYFEPSLADEGMLWFTNLLVPDPTGVLPFVVSGLMFLNLYITKNIATTDSRGMTIVRRLLLGFALMIGPLGQNIPAALMLYWTSSTASVIFWNAWLDRKYPTLFSFIACSRPLLLPPAPPTQNKKI